MQRMILGVILLGALSFSAGAALAVDLVNRDSKSYKVKIHDVGTTHSSIGSNTIRPSVCSRCKIEVVGVGTVKASGSGTKVIIKGGRLSVQ
jgi:hypothetical protein